MRLTRWEPFREMDELFKGFAPFFGRMPVARPAEGLEEFMPLADIVERDKEYLIKLDLPEVRKEDVKVLFDDGVLTIKRRAQGREGREGRQGASHRALFRHVRAQLRAARGRGREGDPCRSPRTAC